MNDTRLAAKTSGRDATFGLFLNVSGLLAPSHSEVFDLIVAETELAERLGYHDVWVTEHHFIPFGINSSAIALAAFLLGRTRRLRVGTAVTLAPLYHPLHLAEQAAILDQTSHGRFDFGIGRGGYLRELEVFARDIYRWDQEVHETIEVLLGAWTKDLVSSSNPYFPFEPVPITPKPFTDPHPPLFVGSVTPAGIESAARNGLPLLHYWASPLEARLAAESQHRKAGGDPEVRHVHSLIVVLCDDETDARQTLRHYLLELFRAGDWPHVPQAQKRHVDAKGNPLDREDLAGYVASQAIVGPPSAVIQQLRSFQQSSGGSRFVVLMEALGQRQPILRSIERFALEVIPAMCV